MSKKVINYKASQEEWNAAIDQEYDKLVKKVKIDGFREGHAPKNMVEKKYPRNSVYYDAANNLIEKKYQSIIINDKIIPMAEPKIDLVKVDDEGLEVNYEFIVESKVTLKDYKGLKVKKNTKKATKEEIEHELSHLLEKYAEISSKDGAVEKGDIALIDFKGFVDGVAFDGGEATNYELEIGSNSFIPGFEDQIIGMKKEEERDIKVTFPKDYQSAELKGKDATFKIKLHDIKVRTVPALDKDFFEDFGMEDINTKEDLEKMIEEQIQARLDMETENEFTDNLLKKASDNMEVEIDEELVTEETERMYQNFLDKMKMQGIPEELYLQYTNSTKEQIKDKMKEEATNRIKFRYLLNEIASLEKINPTKEDAEKEAEEMAKKYNIEKEELLKEFGGIEMMIYDLKMRRAIEVLKENN